MSLQQLFNQGKYKELIIEVDSMYGWTQEELNRVESDYNKKLAEWCLHLGQKIEKEIIEMENDW